tara:strand:+ start:345 stop:557 length:213 start_codon:yes stop_codon:yes gene_type:complete
MAMITGNNINRYAIVVLASALKLYAKTGIKASRAYTPTNMLATATRHTGNKYKRGDYMTAHDDLRALIAD